MLRVRLGCEKRFNIEFYGANSQFKFIEKVRQRTSLYDNKSPDYSDQHMRANAWEGIGRELKIKRKFYVSSRDVRIECPRLNSAKIHCGRRGAQCITSSVISEQWHQQFLKQLPDDELTG
jgi:hypothetical protein